MSKKCFVKTYQMSKIKIGVASFKHSAERKSTLQTFVVDLAPPLTSLLVRSNI